MTIGLHDRESYLLPSNGLAATELEFVWLEVTQRCNLKCDHCYVSSGPDVSLHNRMQHADWLGVLGASRQLGCEAVQFIGGEPMLYPRLDELLQYGRELGFKHMEIYTNAMPINRKWAEKLGAWGVRIATSVYGPTAETHDAVTNKSGSFDRTVSVLKLLRSHDIPVRVGFIEMDKNAGRFDETRSFLSGIGVEHVGQDFSRNFGRGSHARHHHSDKLDKFGDLCGQCWKGRICVTYSGDVFPCIMARAFPIGNVLIDELKTVISSQPLRSFRDELCQREISAFDCIPGSKPKEKCLIFCGPCGPDHSCVPDKLCGPDKTCTPDKPPCRPTDGCAPTDGD